MHNRIRLVFLPLLLSFAFTRASAQEVVVSTGPNYSSEVFYDMQDGITRTEPLADWEIGFQIQGFASSIITNGGIGVRLYAVPEKRIEDFGSAVDTTGLASLWETWYNSAETWELGAFNLNSDYQTGDFGWGEYNMITHTVAGTSLYVIVLPDGTTKQMVIEGLTNGTYTFSYANLDGTNKKTATLNKSDFAGKNFGYYSISGEKNVDREPEGTNWDIVFGKYIAWVGANNDTPYGVMGVRSNEGVMVAEVESSNPAEEPAPSDELYSSNITTIGHDWKTFTTSWNLRENVVYFIKDQDGAIYRLHFTGFGGSSTGEIRFTSQRVDVSSVENNGKIISRFGVYPNIVERGHSFNILFSIEHPISHATVTLFNAAGQVVWQDNLDTSTGFRQIPISTNLPAGAYMTVLDVDGIRSNHQLIVR